MDEIIDFLTALINFDTTAGGDDAERCASYIGDVLTGRGVSVSGYMTAGKHRAGYHLLAEVPGESAGAVMLHAHLDTAEYEDTEGWLFPAGRASRRRGVICGRGAIDCKGPLAVWMKLISDAALKRPLPYTLRLMVSDLEEQGGEEGLGQLLSAEPGILSGVNLVIGEGGGYPFPFHDTLYYTFQTGERYAGDDPEEEGSDAGRVTAVLRAGVEKGYYSEDILAYFREWDTLQGRRLDIRPLYEGMERFFADAPYSPAAWRPCSTV